MQVLLPQIVTVTLLVHMGLGCCWHHAHEFQDGRCVSGFATTDACLCGAHEDDETNHHDGRHDSAEDHSAPDDDGHDRHHCGERCSFVRSEKSPEQNIELSQVASPLEMAARFESVGLVHGRFTPGGLDRRYDPSPPLRAHLLLGVLLI